jgi:hypothetical protein
MVAVIEIETLNHDVEVRREGASAFVLPEDRVVILDQPQFDDRSEIVSLRVE